MQTWYRNHWIQSGGILLTALTLFVIGQACWILPKVEANEALMVQIQNKDTQVKQLLAGLPDLLQFKKELWKEEARLVPIQKEVEKTEAQMLTDKNIASFDGMPGIEKTDIQPTENDAYSEASYKLTQQGSYMDVLYSLHRIESTSPFLKVSSLVFNRAGSDVTIQTDFSFLYGNSKGKQVKIQSGRIQRLPVSERSPFGELPQEQNLLPASASTQK